MLGDASLAPSSSSSSSRDFVPSSERSRVCAVSRFEEEFFERGIRGEKERKVGRSVFPRSERESERDQVVERIVDSLD